MDAEIVDRRLVYDGWYKLFRLLVRMPNGRTVERHLEDHGVAAAVLAFDDERRVALLITQPRAAVLAANEKWPLEAIAGIIGNESPEDAVRREALEEGGVKLGILQPVANIWKIPALSTERVQLYLAAYRQGDRVAAGGGVIEEGESITVHEVPLASLRKMAQRGDLTDAKTLILVQRLMLDRPEIFSEC